MADLSKLANELSGLTVLEAAELARRLEQKWQPSKVMQPAMPRREFKIPTADISRAIANFTLGGEASGVAGPDLGFLRLPPNTVAALGAVLSFYNLSKRQDDVLANRAPTPSYSDAIVGMISELTEDVPTERPRVRRKSFTAIFGPGTSSAITEANGYDLFDFEVTSSPDFKLPNSFGGTSGGAVWRFYIAEKDGAASVVDSRLVSVPFFETPRDGKMITSCHGPKSIYRVLADAIVKRWPEDGEPR